MTENFIKQVVVLGNSDWNSESSEIITDKAFAITGEFDCDNVSGTLTFSLPYIDKRNEDFYENSIEADFKNIIKKRLPIRLFSKLLETNEIDNINAYNQGLLPQVFIGTINSVRLTRDKNNYNFNIECIGALTFVANEFRLPISKQTNTYSGTEYFNAVISEAGATVFIPATQVLYNVSDSANTAFIKWSDSNNLMEVFSSVKDSYGMRVHQQGNGYVNLFDPLYFFTQDVNDEILGTQILAWEFTLGDNMFNIDYGDLTTDVQMVEVVGLDDKGQAIDPIGMALKASELNISEDDPSIYNKLTFYRPDIVSRYELELAAKNILLELMRNNVITFQTMFEPDINCMDFVTVADGEKYSGLPMQIKSYSFSIDKSDVSMTITAFRSTLALQPAELITDVSGITDLDIMQIRKDVETLYEWGAFAE